MRIFAGEEWNNQVGLTSTSLHHGLHYNIMEKIFTSHQEATGNQERGLDESLMSRSILTLCQIKM